MPTRSKVVGRGFEVDGVPFFYNGIQFSPQRLQQRDGWTYDEMLEVVRAAADLGFTVLGIPILWSSIEPIDGAIDWSDLEWAIAAADEFGMRLELLWFGSQVCSVSTPSHGTPAWVIDQYAKTRDRTGAELLVEATDTVFDVAATYTKLSVHDELLRARETAVVGAMMDHVSRLRGDHTVVVGVEVLNEPTATVLWSTPADLLVAPSPADTIALARYLDSLGRAVKDSAHPVWTRVNLYDELEGADAADLLVRELRHSSIDFVGADIYTREASTVRDYVARSRYASDDRPVMIMENGAHYENTPELLAACLAGGGWYHVWEVCDSMPSWPAGLFAVESKTLIPKAHTDRVRRFNRALAQVAGDLATLVPERRVREMSSTDQDGTGGDLVAISFVSGSDQVVVGLDGVVRVRDGGQPDSGPTHPRILDPKDTA